MAQSYGPLNLKTYWQAEYATCPAIPHLLRDAYPERWIRFHSLPESKRYAENESEYQTILHRHNAVLDHLTERGTPLLLVSTEFGDTDIPTRAGSPLVALDPDASCDWTFKADPEDDGLCFCHLYTSEWEWHPGIFDPILRLVADWTIVDTMIICSDSKWIFHPYDGGADVILPTSESRDDLKSRFSGWLSELPSGL